MFNSLWCTRNAIKETSFQSPDLLTWLKYATLHERPSLPEYRGVSKIVPDRQSILIGALIIYIMSRKRDFESTRHEKRGIQSSPPSSPLFRSFRERDNGGLVQCAGTDSTSSSECAERERLFIISTVLGYSLYRRSPWSRGMDGLPSAESGEEPGQAGEGRNSVTGGKGRRTDRRARRNLDESTRGDEETTRGRRSAHYRADRSAVGLAHYNFYDWSFGPLGALTRMPTCKGRITVTAETGLSAKVFVAFKSGESARYRRSELICAEFYANTGDFVFWETGMANTTLRLEDERSC